MKKKKNPIFARSIRVVLLFPCRPKAFASSGLYFFPFSVSGPTKASVLFLHLMIVLKGLERGIRTMIISLGSVFLL